MPADGEWCFVHGKGLLNTSAEFQVRKLCVSIPLLPGLLRYIHFSCILWQKYGEHLCFLEAGEGKNRLYLLSFFLFLAFFWYYFALS